MPEPQLHDVDVDGGTLRVARWEGAGHGAQAVVLLHGITASHLAWRAIAERLQPDVTVLAPDLRGRGGSNQLGGPFGMAVHARDVLTAATALGVDRMVLAGHSMGGFAATATAVADPSRVAGLLLVDGGPATGLAPLDMDPDEAAELLLGPALRRLRMTFASREQYRDFWRGHPAFEDRWSPDVEAYVDYDLEGEPGALRSKVSEDAARGDYRDLLATRTPALDAVTCPVVFLHAPRGLRNEPPGLYPADVLKALAERYPRMTIELVDDCNHYTVVFDDRCADLVAARLRGLVSS